LPYRFWERGRAIFKTIPLFFFFKKTLKVGLSQKIKIPFNI
jgi:hypothetical protein